MVPSVHALDNKLQRYDRYTMRFCLSPTKQIQHNCRAPQHGITRKPYGQTKTYSATPLIKHRIGNDGVIMDEMKRRVIMSAKAVKNMDIIKTVSLTFRLLVWYQKKQTYLVDGLATTRIDKS